MELRCREALTDREKAAAEEIVCREYVRSGYLVPGGNGDTRLPSSAYLDTPQARTCILEWNTRIIGTVSVVVDSSRGVPMDALYKQELDLWRAREKLLAEVVQLAIDESIFDQFGVLQRSFQRLRFLAPLFQTALDYAESAHIALLCITVNPKHDGLYARIGFQTVGEPKPYGALNEAPTVGKVLELDASAKKFLQDSFLKP